MGVQSGTALLTSVPTLDQIATDPTMAVSLPVAAKRELALRAVIALAALVPQWETSPSLAPPQQQQGDELIDLEEAARRLSMPVATLRNRTTREPWRSLRTSNGTRYVRFSAARIAAYLRGELLAPTWSTGRAGSAGHAPASRRVKERGTT